MQANNESKVVGARGVTRLVLPGTALPWGRARKVWAGMRSVVWGGRAQPGRARGGRGTPPSSPVGVEAIHEAPFSRQ